MTDDVNAHYISTASLQFYHLNRANDTIAFEIITPNHQCKLCYFNALVVIKSPSINVINAMEHCAIELQMAAKKDYIYLGAVSHVISNNADKSNIACYIYECKTHTIIRIPPNQVNKFSITVEILKLRLNISPVFQMRACKNISDMNVDSAVVKVMQDKLTAVIQLWDNEGGKVPNKDACKGLSSRTDELKDRKRSCQKPKDFPLDNSVKGKISKTRLPATFGGEDLVTPKQKKSRLNSISKRKPNKAQDDVDDENVDDTEDVVIKKKNVNHTMGAEPKTTDGIKVNSSIQSGGKKTSDASVSSKQVKSTTNTSVSSEQDNITTLTSINSERGKCTSNSSIDSAHIKSTADPPVKSTRDRRSRSRNR